MQRKTKIELEQYKQRFEQHLFAVVKRRYDVQLTQESALAFSSMFRSVNAPEKKLFWTDLAESMGEDRAKLYKYYNNTYKPYIMPRFPADLLDYFGAVAAKTATAILQSERHISEQRLVIKAMEQTKSAVNFNKYDDVYHPDAGYHKIRNSIISCYNSYQFSCQSESRENQSNHRRVESSIESNAAQTDAYAREANKLQFKPFPSYEEDYDSDECLFELGNYINDQFIDVSVSHKQETKSRESAKLIDKPSIEFVAIK